jgi:hypothetical protein
MKLAETEPVALGSAVTAVLPAVLAVLTAFDIWQPTEDQSAALYGLITAIIAVVAAAFTRRKAWSPASVAQVVSEAVEAAAPAPEHHDGVITAITFSERLGTWSTVYLHPEATPDEGSFVLTGATRDGLVVAEYRPGRDGTHTPLGPEEMSARGLRPAVPHPDEAGR